MARHNIVARLRTACRNRFTITHENRPVGSTNLRPDLVVAHDEEAIILTQITDPTPSPQPALSKITKFKPVRLYLVQRYQRVTVDTVIVGAVCSWDPKNDAIMRRICTHSYLKLFKKLVVSEVITASQEIYHNHIAHR